MASAGSCCRVVSIVMLPLRYAVEKCRADVSRGDDITLRLSAIDLIDQNPPQITPRESFRDLIACLPVAYVISS